MYLLQEEFAAFRDTAERIAEAKDAELDRVLGLNAGLRDELTIISSRQATTVPLHGRVKKFRGEFGSVHEYHFTAWWGRPMKKGL